MKPLPDSALDDLRDQRGYLFRGTPAHAWSKPRSVSLRKKSFRNMLEGTLSNGSELEFVMEWAPPLDRRIRPGKEILEQFLSLAFASDDEIHRFASKYGPLLIFCQMQEFEDRGVFIESCEVWRYFAASMRSLLRIASNLRAGREGDPVDWDTIGVCPTVVARTKPDNYDWLNASPQEHEKSWKVLASFIYRGQHRDRVMWERLLNLLLGLGRVRPWIVMEGTRGAANTRMMFTGPNLLSHLALQLCLMASGAGGFATCSACNKTFIPPKRAPKSGQRTFCPECRDSGEPVALAQRDRQARLRSKQSGRHP